MNLIDELNRYDGNNMLIPYWQVALYFPSDEPHPDYVDRKRVDDEALQAFGVEHGYEISPLNDKIPPW